MLLTPREADRVSRGNGSSRQASSTTTFRRVLEADIFATSEPRLIPAYSMSWPLVTEPSMGIRKFSPPRCTACPE